MADVKIKFESVERLWGDVFLMKDALSDALHGIAKIQNIVEFGALVGQAGDTLLANLNLQSEKTQTLIQKCEEIADDLQVIMDEFRDTESKSKSRFK